jgi:hypothetical protein
MYFLQKNNISFYKDWFFLGDFFMRTRKFIYASLALAFLISCSDEGKSSAFSAISETGNTLTEQEVKVLFKMREPNNRVSMDEVMKLTNEIIGFLDGEESLKSGSNRKVNSISALVSDNKPALKSSDFDDIEIPDTLAYVLNFNDSLGFVIISADTRIDNPILAFTEDGSLIDSTDNLGIAIFLERLEDYLLNSIVEAEQQKDSLLDIILGKLTIESDSKAFPINTSGVTYTPVGVVDRKGPLVPVEWDQGALFNNSLKDMGCYGEGTPKNGKPWAGCVATAVAQIMSRWKHPASINGYSFNWAELNQYTARPNAYPGAGDKDIYSSSVPNNVKSQIANLFQQIGNGVNMKYDCYGSGADTDNSVSFLSNQGFKTGGIKDYDSSSVITSLNNERPLMAVGCAIKTVTTTTTKFLGITISTSTRTSYDECHQWVIDGYLKQKVIIAIQGSGISFETHIDYMHNNWGWSGGSNGYFLNSVFYNSNLIPLSSNTKSYQSGNFQYWLKIVPNIYK